MEALEIEGQTDQTPLASRRLYPAQGELAEAQDLFDDPDHRFDRTLARPVDRFAQGGLELVGHLDLGTGILRWRLWERGKPLMPARMMRITTRSNVRFDPTLATCNQGCRTKIPGIQRCRIGRADGFGDGLERGFSFLRVVGVIGECMSYDEQTGLIHRNLCIVILFKTGIRWVFHDT